MTKAKLHSTVLELCAQHNAPKALTEALSDLTKPKVGGSSDVNDYTVFDKDGNVTHVFCTYHKLWEPVTTKGVDENGKPITVPLFKKNDKTKNGYERACIEAIKSWNTQAKTYRSTNDAVVSDLLEGVIDNVKAKKLLADAEAVRAKHTPRKDKLGTADKPVSVPKAS